MQDKESGFGDSVGAIAFSPDGSRIAAVSGYGLWVWDRESDSVAVNIHDPSRINCVSFSSRTPILAIGLYDAIKLVSLESKAVVATLERKRSSHIYDLALSPSGETVASLSGGSEIQVWSVSDRQLIATASDQPSYLEALAFSPDGSLLATGGHEVCLRDARTCRISATFGEHSETWSSLRFSPDGSLLFAVGNLHANAARFCSWNISTKQATTNHEFPQDEWVMATALSLDSRLVAAGLENGAVKVWNTADGQLLRTFTRHTKGVLGLEFSPDASILASGGKDWRMLFEHVR